MLMNGRLFSQQLLEEVRAVIPSTNFWQAVDLNSSVHISLGPDKEYEKAWFPISCEKLTTSIQVLDFKHSRACCLSETTPAAFFFLNNRLCPTHPFGKICNTALNRHGLFCVRVGKRI
ncbi:hypothetical protein ILYODFUR_012355 [Ilyodon furcidens]|uniref:Uncharacterized protein n=1 Tax=Ilyodon furcidens TaxID=33524 RepID=A0ABV0TB57_9TELE